MMFLLKACAFFILDVCTHIVLIGFLWVERVMLNWLFDIDYVEKIKEWIKNESNSSNR